MPSEGVALSSKARSAQNREVMDSKNMVGKNRSSKQILQKKVGKPSSLEGEVTTIENMVVLETDPGGRGSSKNTFLTKRKL